MPTIATSNVVVTRTSRVLTPEEGEPPFAVSGLYTNRSVLLNVTAVEVLTSYTSVDGGRIAPDTVVTFRTVKRGIPGEWRWESRVETWRRVLHTGTHAAVLALLIEHAPECLAPEGVRV